MEKATKTRFVALIQLDLLVDKHHFLLHSDYSRSARQMQPKSCLNANRPTCGRTSSIPKLSARSQIQCRALFASERQFQERLIDCAWISRQSSTLLRAKRAP